jgi:hypothetical protein
MDPLQRSSLAVSTFPIPYSVFTKSRPQDRKPLINGQRAPERPNSARFTTLRRRATAAFWKSTKTKRYPTSKKHISRNQALFGPISIPSCSTFFQNSCPIADSSEAKTLAKTIFMLEDGWRGLFQCVVGSQLRMAWRPWGKNLEKYLIELSRTGRSGVQGIAGRKFMLTDCISVCDQGLHVSPTTCTV